MRFLLLLLVAAFPLFAAPSIDKHFNDFTNTIPSEKANLLDSRLETFETNTGHQFVVAIFPKLEGDLEQTTIELAREWKLGQKDKNDGILFAIFLQSPSGGGKMRFEVGYGLEGDLTDGKTKILLDTKIKPLFKQKKFYEGIDLAISDITSILKGETVVEQNSDNTFGAVIFWIALIVICIIILITLASISGGGGGYYSSGSSGSSYSSGGGSSWGGGGGSFGGGGSSSDF